MTSRPGFLIDSNVVIDVAQRDPVWFDWSSEQLAKIVSESAAYVDPIIYGEVSVVYADGAALDRALADLGLEREPLPFEAAFLAGRAHLAYRKAGGIRLGVLPDA